MVRFSSGMLGIKIHKVYQLSINRPAHEWNRHYSRNESVSSCIDEKELSFINLLHENPTCRNSNLFQILRTNALGILKEKADYSFIEMNIAAFLVQSQFKPYA